MMKSKVIDRPMFKKKGPPVPPEDVNNVGIMQGFMDQISMMDDMEGEEEDDEEMEMGKMMDRRPDSPEILMNNLRGDMRSVDARVEELADLVGYRAASETPTEVLALLQPVLAQQGAMVQPPPQMAMPAQANPMAAPAGGVADLAAMAQGPQTAPPMPMPEAPPPGGIGSLPAAAEQQAPIAMKDGGIVQHFQEGSGEEGVTPVDLSGQQAFYPPELVAKAQQDVLDLMTTQQQRLPSLESAMASRLPMYERLLGTDKQAVQAQMLFDIAQGALNVAAGVDAEGNRVRGAVSPVGRIAAGMRNVPALIGARAGELAKGQREAKLLALQAGEKDIALLRDYNFKLIDSQRKLSGDIVKAAAKGQGFGSGVKGAAWNFVTRFAPDFAAGKLTPENDRRFKSSYAIISEPTYITNPFTGNLETRRPPIPDFISNAIKLRDNMPLPAPSGKGKGKKGEAAPVSEAVPMSEAPVTTAPGPVTTAPGAAAPVREAAPVTTAPTKQPAREVTLWQLTPVLTGPVATVKDVISSVPGFGNVGADVTQARARYLGDFRELVKSLQNSPVFAQGERAAIEKELDIEPRFFDDPAKLRNKLIGIDSYLTKRLTDAQANASNANLPVEQRKEHTKIVTTIQNFLPKLGIPEKIYTDKARQTFIKRSLPGTPYLWNGTTLEYTDPVALTTREEVQQFARENPPNTPFMYDGMLYYTKGKGR